MKTPDELLAEQEQLGAEQEKASAAHKQSYDDSGSGPTEEEKRREWDDKQATLEMQRAARSAETCPESVTEKSPKGRAAVSLTFSTTGRVTEATISSPYDAEAGVGKCVLRAMKAVIVPAYQGDAHTVQWEVDLTGAKRSGPPGGDKTE